MADQRESLGLADSSPTGQREALHDLRTRIEAAPQGEKPAVVRQWAKEVNTPNSSTELSHLALSIRDIVDAIQEDIKVPQKKKLVIVLHGIRDPGVWMEMVKEVIKSENVVVQPVDFEDFDVVRFMAGVGVGKIIQGVVTKIRHAKSVYPDSELIAIAHSFGTYVISKIIENEPDVGFSRVIFCGSVVPRGFRFDRVRSCPHIVNECGGRDILPVIAQGFSLWHRYGTAGVLGLRLAGIEDRYHDFDHVEFLDSTFVETYWKSYVHENVVVPSPFQANRRPVPRGVILLTYGWWLFLYAILFVCIGGAIGHAIHAVHGQFYGLLAVTFVLVVVVIKIWVDVRKFRKRP